MAEEVRIRSSWNSERWVEKSIGKVAKYKKLSDCGMEEIAAYVKAQRKHDSGVRFVQRATEGDGKKAARQAVLDILGGWNDYREHAHRLHVLCMPGAMWKFERMLLNIREYEWPHRTSPATTRFTGIENDRAVFYSAVTQMPGLRTPHAYLKKIEPFPFAELGVKTKFAALFFANVDDFMAHDWREGVSWDCVWLDYTGPLTAPRLRVIAQFYERHVRSVLVVTALKGRWNKKTSEAITRASGHAEWIKQHIPGTVLHEIEYCDSSPMAQIAIQKAKA